MKKLLQRLTETSGPSGYEEAVRDLIRGEVEHLADEVRVDALGSLIVHKAPSAARRGGKRIMIAAHMDEMGLMASHLDEAGFIRFAPLGGVLPRYLPGSRVRFLNGVQGLVGWERVGTEAGDPAADKMFIDVGASSLKECPVRVGDVAAFDAPFEDLGGHVIARALANRAGVTAVIETLRLLTHTPHDLYFVFTSRGQVGFHGARTAAYGLEPELAIAVEATSAGDTPGAPANEVALGKGPAVKIRDGAMLADPRVVAWMTRTAEKSRLPYQREVAMAGDSDARLMQISRSGVPSGALSIPVRYIHSPSEMIAMDDLTGTVALLAALLRSPVRLDA